MARCANTRATVMLIFAFAGIGYVAVLLIR